MFGAFLLLAGCRQIVGIEPREVSDGGPSLALVPVCGLQAEGVSCASCISMNCCAQAQQCAKDSACDSTEGCIEKCAGGDSVCRLACSNSWDPVSSVQALLSDCRQQFCADACGPWNCLGNVTWGIQDPIPAQIAISATVKCATCSVTGGTDIIEGVHVRVCSIADPECKAQPELASGYTDQLGRVALTLSMQGKPASVFLELHKDAWVDDLLMLDTPPLSYDFNAGVVKMDTQDDITAIASNDLATSYDPSRAAAKLRVSNCNLQSSAGIDVTWSDSQGATSGSFDASEWNAVAVNLPVPANLTTRVVARLKDPNPATSQDGGTGPFIASVNLVVRPGAITLAPFVTPTP